MIASASRCRPARRTSKSLGRVVSNPPEGSVSVRPGVVASARRRAASIIMRWRPLMRARTSASWHSMLDDACAVARGGAMRLGARAGTMQRIEADLAQLRATAAGPSRVHPVFMVYKLEKNPTQHHPVHREGAEDKTRADHPRVRQVVGRRRLFAARASARAPGPFAAQARRGGSPRGGSKPAGAARWRKGEAENAPDEEIVLAHRFLARSRSATRARPFASAPTPSVLAPFVNHPRSSSARCTRRRCRVSCTPPSPAAASPSNRQSRSRIVAHAAHRSRTQQRSRRGDGAATTPRPAGRGRRVRAAAAAQRHDRVHVQMPPREQHEHVVWEVGERTAGWSRNYL